MLKMHGIVIDENKTVIANIDTLEKEKMGALSFRFVKDQKYAIKPTHMQQIEMLFYNMYQAELTAKIRSIA